MEVQTSPSQLARFHYMKEASFLNPFEYPSAEHREYYVEAQRIINEEFASSISNEYDKSVDRED